MKPGAKAISKVRSTLAFVLVFWCAGAGCMVVSYARGASMRASTLSSGNQSSEGSRSIGAHRCCQARKSGSKDTTFQTDSIAGALPELNEALLPAAPIDSGVTSCCPLTSGSFISASGTVSTKEKPAGANQLESFLLGTMRLAALPVLTRRLPDQNQTYLRSCAFLI
jgi:hypothetical protein